MLFNPKTEDRLARLAYQLWSAPAITPELFFNVIADACTRLPVLNRAGKAVRIDRLIGAGALERRGACFDRTRIAGMEASSPCLRGWRMALLSFQAAQICL